VAIQTGARIAYLRKQLKLRQEDVAKKVSVGRTFIVDLEAGKKAIAKELIPSLASALKVTKRYLQSAEGNEKISNNLEKVYHSLLDERFEKVLAFEQLQSSIDNLQQEMSARLLLATAYYLGRDKENAEKLEKDYLDFFLARIKVEDSPAHFQKFYYLYLYQKSLFEGDFNQSLNACDILMGISSDAEKNIFWLKKVDLYIKQGDYSTAFGILEKAFSLIGKESESPLLAKAFIYQSAIYAHLKMYDFCLENLDTLEKNIEKNGLSEHRIVLAHQRGYIYSQKNHRDKAFSYYEEALNYPTTPERKFVLSVSLITLAIKMADTDKAKEHLANTRQLNLTEYEKMVLSSCEAEIFLCEKDEEAFLKMKKTVLKYFETNRCIRDLVHNYSVLSTYYLERNQIKKALYYLQKKEDLSHEKI